MRLASEILNLSVELRGRYQQVFAAGGRSEIGKANEVVAAIYVFSCGSLVVGLNAVAGKTRRKVLIDRRTVAALAATLGGGTMIDRILANAEQFVAICAAIRDPRAQAIMNRYQVEWHQVVDDANARLHAMIKRAKP